MVRNILVLLICCALSMVLSFSIVLHLARRTSNVTKSEPVQDIMEATQLRQYSNELVRLTEEYLKNIESVEDREKWLSNSFRPRLNNLRHVILNSGLSGKEISGLSNASDRVAAMSSSPEDKRLRELAIAGVLRVTQSVEKRIRKAELQDSLPEPVEIPGFGP